MKRYLAYLAYLLRHKWGVFVAAQNKWVGFWHDMSKFRPDEFVPYARHFYAKNGMPQQDFRDPEYDLAWLKHQHRNKHHWQHWILVMDEDANKVLPMPDRYRLEMLADWLSFGGDIDKQRKWYVAHKNKMILHEETRQWVEDQLDFYTEETGGRYTRQATSRYGRATYRPGR